METVYAGLAWCSCGVAMNDAWVYMDIATRRWVYRASSFGSCTRSLTAARLGESATGPHANLRAAMDASAGLEDVILERAEQQLGVPIVGRQETVDLEVGVIIEGPDGKEMRNVVVRGHPDGMTDDCIIEVKALAHANFTRYNDGGLDALGSLGDKYKWQMAVYGHATGRNVRLVVGEKWREEFHPDTGKWVVREVVIAPPVSPDSLFTLDDIHKRIRTIEEHAAIDELPPCDANCREGDPFSEVHFFEAPIKGDDALLSQLERFHELKELLGDDGSRDKAKRCGLLGELEDIKDAIKDQYGNMARTEKVTVGPFTARLVPSKGQIRVDTKDLAQRYPEVHADVLKPGTPYIQLIVKKG